MMSDDCENVNKELIRLLSGSDKNQSAKTDFTWSSSETVCLLKLISEYDYLPQIQANSEQVYKKLGKLMTISGYKRTDQEIKIRWIELSKNWDRHRSGNFESVVCFDQFDALFNSHLKKDPNTMFEKDSEFNEQNDKRTKSRNWTSEETEHVVEVLEKYGNPTRTNLKKIVYLATDYLKQRGFYRTEEQTYVKIKHLRSSYSAVKRKVLPEEEFPHFLRMEKLMENQKTQEKSHSTTQNYITFDEQSKSDDDIMIEFVDNNEDDTDISYKRRRQTWTNKEMDVFLSFIEENGVVTGKQLRKIADKAVDFLAERGFLRTITQVLIRWKNTRSLYWATYRKKLKFPERECVFYSRMHAILNSEDQTYDINESECSKENGTEEKEMNSIKTLQFVELENSNFCNQVIAEQSSTTNDPLESEESVPAPKREKRNECMFCSSLDHVDHYCISLAYSFRKLDARKQAKLKIEIQQLMFKAEFDRDF